MTEKVLERKRVTCSHCGGHDFNTKTFRVAPGEFDLRNPLQWLGSVMTAYVCTKCGHVEFFADQGR